MDDIQIPEGNKPDMVNFFKKLFSGADGQFIQLESAATGNVLKPGQKGYFGTDIYIHTQNGTKIKITGASWS